MTCDRGVCTRTLWIPIVSVLLMGAGYGNDGPLEDPNQAGSATGSTALSSSDTEAVGCAQPGVEHKLTVKDISDMLAAKVPDNVVRSAIQGRTSTLDISPAQIAELKTAGASDELLMTLTSGSEVYIGWSVLPSKVVRDNYGRHVMNKYFGVDIVIANRNTGPGGNGDNGDSGNAQSLIVTALEFCHRQLRDVSIDPTLVRGSLQKGELTGRRTQVSHLIQAIGDVASPSAAFFKNEIHRGTFSGAAALFTPCEPDLNWCGRTQSLPIWKTGTKMKYSRKDSWSPQVPRTGDGFSFPLRSFTPGLSERKPDVILTTSGSKRRRATTIQKR
ncbi:MAG: hypothetical protein DMG89_10410 [Acidobacteria bacterium]|nr:MAG: hypothetical protein DMG89_10410 [Acidobacteriota bacterium]